MPWELFGLLVPMRLDYGSSGVDLSCGGRELDLMDGAKGCWYGRT